MKHFLILLLIPLLCAWPSVNLGGGVPVVGGGSLCSAPDNFLSSPAAAHLYFWQNSTIPAGIPGDEASGTDIALTASNNLSDADLSNTDLPAGTPTSSTYRSISLDGSTENALAAYLIDNWAASADNQDRTAVFWVKFASLTTSDDSIAFGHSADDDGWFYVTSDGSADYGTPGHSGSLRSSAGSISAATWTHIALRTENDGSTGGNDARTIFVNGAAVAGPTNNVDNVVALDPWVLKPNGWIANGVETEVHAFALFHSALTEAQIRENACCGFNGEANPTSRDAILAGGVDCSTY